MSDDARMQGAGWSDPRSEVRRRDRGKDDDWIRAFLGQPLFGVLATVGPEGQPFVNSNIFVFDENRGCIYLHTHRSGRTRENVNVDDKVAFSVAQMGRLLPAAAALEFSVGYAGVVVFGKGRVVQDGAEAKEALQQLLDKYAPHLQAGRDYRPTTDDELARTAVYRIDIEAWSGKQKEVEADFPGAYEAPEVPVPFPEPTTEAD